MFPTAKTAVGPFGQPSLKLHALGAARAVTGSLFLFQYSYDGKVEYGLLDVGSTVEDPKVDLKRRLPQGVNAADIKCIIISHGHADHCGYLPKLVKDGFKGKVYVTPATADLMGIILPDSAHLQVDAAKRINKRFQRWSEREQARSGKAVRNGKGKGNRNGRKNRRSYYLDRQIRQFRKAEPLYEKADVQAAMKLLVPVDYHIRRRISPEIAFTFTDAGHILGSAVVNLEFGNGDAKRTICFTGNVGRRNMPLLRDLEPVKAADTLMLEATYGNKLHLKRDRLAVLEAMLRDGYKRAKRSDPVFGCGKILIPVFAVGRAQTVLNDLRILMESGRVPVMPVYVDGRMTNDATDVYKKHPKIMNAETRKLLEAGKDPYATPRHTICREHDEHLALLGPQPEPVVIVASSGMASGGRIMDHLALCLPGKQNTVIFVGHQGEGTTGETLVSTMTHDSEGNPNPDRRALQQVRIGKLLVRLGAKIYLIPDYSAHGDYEDQMAWCKLFKQPPKRVLIVHGEQDGVDGLKAHIQKTLGWKKVIVPSLGQVFEL